MNRFRLVAVWISTLFISTALSVHPVLADSEKIQFFLPDAQFKSHTVKAFITCNIPSTGDPRLSLAAIGKQVKIIPDKGEAPITFAPNQEWVTEIDGQSIGKMGTLLLFDLSDHPVPFYKAMTRFTPVLSWKEINPDTQKVETRFAIGKRSVYLGNLPGSAGWTFIIVLSLVLLIVFMARQNQNKAMYLFCGPRGYLSLSRVQVGAWTLVIGTVVLSYGMVGMQVPDIPNSLIALMGFSLGTGGLNYISADMKKSGEAKPPSQPIKGALHLKHLVCQPEEGSEKLTPSLVKAQMVFWTGLLLVIFVVKSLLDRAMWDIPWEMVAMMGMSQAGYLSPKFIPQKDAASKDTPPKNP